MKKYCTIALMSLLAGCQSNGIDSQVDMRTAIDMTFCDGSGLNRFNPATRAGQPTWFSCKNGLSVNLPSQTIFQSDEEYISKYYDELLLIEESSCPGAEDSVSTLIITRNKQGLQYNVACKVSGRFMVETSFFDDIEKQVETSLGLEDYCEDEPFKLINITRKSPRNITYKFTCGDAKYSIPKGITPDDVADLNALHCDYSGFASLTAKLTNTKQATFTCRDGFKTTTQF
ncbi:hypothetical protein [Vibrio diazotrophicus]|uniref:hypothetical protein n=1 Tax=Vibrio diazotrophicus TaxID=685 RepID=UPI0005A94A24|nr:hypothetical protein [Vibrio diazotrophicus]